MYILVLYILFLKPIYILLNVANQVSHLYIIIIISLQLKMATIKQSQPFEVTQIYRMYRIMEKMPNHYGPNKKIKKFLIQFNRQKLQQYKLKKCISYNRVLFNKCKELIQGQNLHKIDNQVDIQGDPTIDLYIKPYKYRLNQYCKKYEISQKKSIQIMKQIVQALYCLKAENYICYNIRAENFVLVQQNIVNDGMINIQQNDKIKRWKLQSVPFSYDVKNVESPYTWSTRYQCPQAYNRQLDQKQLKQSLVWNIGCLWLQILYGKNLFPDEHSIKRFCIGSGKTGKHNVQIFGLTKKLSSQNHELLKKMLQIDPQFRMSLDQLYHQKLFYEKKIQGFGKNTKSKQKLFKHHSYIKLQKHLLDFAQYLNMNQFVVKLIKIVSQHDIFVVEGQQSIIKQAVQNLSPEQKFKMKIDQNSMKILKNANSKEKSSLTLQQVVSYLQPYKFYYDKTIFLANCSAHISKILKNYCQSQSKFHRNQNQISPLCTGFNQTLYDNEILFIFGIAYMRLIYLQLLSQNLRLSQNVFCIPSLINITQQNYNIQNPCTSNNNKQWIQFRQSSIYHALKLFINKKLSQAQNNFNLILENYVLKNKSISKINSQLLSNIYKNVNYKNCTIHRYMPYYQKILKQAIQIVDKYGTTKKKYKNPPSSEQMIQSQQNMKNIGYLLIAAFIENQHIFMKTYQGKLFIRYYQQQVQADKNIRSNRLSLSSKCSVFSGGMLTKQFNINDNYKNEYFSFKKYEQFLNFASQQIVSKQVNYMLSKFTIQL